MTSVKRTSMEVASNWMIKARMLCAFFSFKQKTAYEMDGSLEFRRVLFRSRLERLADRFERRVDELRALLGALIRLRRHSLDRKSTRLNSSHPSISYAVFCLKK